MKKKNRKFVFELMLRWTTFTVDQLSLLGVSKWMDWMDLDWIVNGWIKVIHLSINNPLKWDQKNPIQSIHLEIKSIHYHHFNEWISNPSNKINSIINSIKLKYPNNIIFQFKYYVDKILFKNRPKTQHKH